MYKKLLSQTLIYGMSNVLIRLFPFVITPMLVKAFGPEKYAIYADFYSMAGIISVLLTHGMETSFFRFSQKFESQQEKDRVYTTALFSVISISALFIILGFIFRNPLARAFKHPDHVNFLVWFLFILGFDAITAIPFAKLRLGNRAFHYSSLKLLSSFLVFIFTLLFVFWIPKSINTHGFLSSFFQKFYNYDYGIGYSFAANLLASIIIFICLIPTMIKAKPSINFNLWKKMFRYSWPIAVAGLAGIINETMDRQFLKYLLPEDIAATELGIYSAVYKIATFITLFKTAYLLGVEPFFFSHAKEANSGTTYAQLMKYYMIFSIIILLFLVANLEWIGRLYIPNAKYWIGFDLVPIILIGATFLGIYLNLSIWYKLSDNTHYGAILSIIGAAVTIIINVIGIPHFGYWACAWATFFSYLVMMTVSYFWGQKIYPIPYNNRKLIFYLFIGCAFSIISYYCFNGLTRIVIGNILLFTLFMIILKIEKKDIEKIKEKIIQKIKK